MMAVLARIVRAVCVFIAAGSLFPEAALASDWVSNPDDALLLELRSGSYVLGEPIRGYQTPQGVCIDFADAIQSLDVPVRLDKKSRRATGWFFSEDQRLVVDREANQVQTANRRESIAAGEIFDTAEGWCINLETLSRWAGVRFRADLSNQAVILASDRKLPFLEALDRKHRAARLQSGAMFPGQAGFDLANLPRAKEPYRAWRSPSLDLQLQGSWSSGQGLAFNYEALAGGELLGMSLAARVAGRGSPSPDTLRLKLYRNEAEGGLLGPLGATQIALGDVETPPGRLTGQGAYGRGAFVSNRSLQLPSRFGVTTLRGILPAGWDAELYRNGVLRAYASDRGDGRYEFPDIELQFGENEFEVILYGPQGQIRHERFSQNVGTADLPAGRTGYWAGILEEGTDLAGLGAAPYRLQSGWRWGVGVERGLDGRTMGGVAYHSQFRSGRRKHYLEGSMRRSVGPILLEVSGAHQLGGGMALRLEGVGRVKGVNFAGHALWLNGEFDSDLAPALQRRELGLRLSGQLALGSWHLPVEAGLRQTLTRQGLRITEFLTRSSFQAGRASLTVELLRRQAAGPERLIAVEERGNRVGLVGNTQIGKLRIRGQVTVGLDGTAPGMQRSQMVFDLPAGRKGMVRGGFDYDHVAKRREYSLAYVQQFRRFALRGEGRMDSRGNLGLVLTMAFSLGPDPADGGWRISSERLAETGQASVEVYRDDNGDGSRQDNEPVVPGVALQVGFRQSDQTTSAKGLAVIDGLAPYVPVRVSIDTRSLPDPLLQPQGRGVVVVPRPGVASRLLLGLSPTGEIEALLLGPDGEPRSGMDVELVDVRGVVIRRGQSDFDGYLFFDSVPYGTYRLRLSAEAAAKMGVGPDLGGLFRINHERASLRMGQLRTRPQSALPSLARAD